jgi:hypothetical protein
MNGPCPDAFFFRTPDLELRNGLPLCGNLHILAPAADEPAALTCASVIADQLCWPEEMPAKVCMPMWKNPADAWPYETPMLAEIRRRLKAAPVIFVCMVLNGRDTAHFVYEPRPNAIAHQLNTILAQSLVPFSQATH